MRRLHAERRGADRAQRAVVLVSSIADFEPSSARPQAKAVVMETEAASQSLDAAGFLDRLPSRWVLLTLLCLALVVRGRMMLGNLDSLEKDPDAYRDAASNIYFEGTLGYWNNASSAIEPTATRPPLY